MAEIMTKVHRASVDKFLQGIRDEEKRQECYQVLRIMKRATKTEPKMWGPSIVGFGECRYSYDSRREVDWFLAGFSPRAQSLTLYLTGGLDREMLKKLGKHKHGRNCLYINKLDDVDKKVLVSLITRSVQRANGGSKR